jgi:cytidyltransferase-like protein
MKSFLELIEENASADKHHVMTFGRMNPPTTGHLKLIDKVKDVAKKNKAEHTVVVSHTQDSKKNPLSAEQKLKHLKRYSPDTHFKAASKEHPSFLHHAAELNKKGVTHLHLVVGSDRVKEMKDTLHRYNGTHPSALHNFKKITIHSAGHRDPDAEGTEGMSASKMREHAKNKDSHSFRQGVPHHVSDTHSNELMHDVRKGMGLHEELYRGQFKAIFLTGGPGSGKDIIIREAIAESNICELNFIQVKECLYDKQRLSERTNNYRRESIRNRGPLIINGPADDFKSISYIKEELEELGYETMMIFVATTNETSKERNSFLTRMMTESIRQDKWTNSHNNIQNFNETFDTFITFDNTGCVNSKEEDINYVYQHTNAFIDSITVNETSENWFIRNSKLIEERKNAKLNKKLIQQGNRKVDAQAKVCGHKVLADNNCPYCQISRKAGSADSVKDGDVASNGTYTFRTYSEQSQPTVKVNASPKEPNFQKDKDKKVKRGNTSSSSSRVGEPSGVGSTYDSRGTGGLTGGAGLGGIHSESQDYSNASPTTTAMPRGVTPNPLSGVFEKKKAFKKFRNEAIDDPGANDMGVGGVLGGASNKEPLVTPMDKFGMSGITIKKKKDKTK